MKSITIIEPWASLIADRKKQIEHFVDFARGNMILGERKFDFARSKAV
ncbi:hypothetical protein [Sporomusa aerivorans]